MATKSTKKKGKKKRLFECRFWVLNIQKTIVKNQIQQSNILLDIKKVHSLQTINQKLDLVQDESMQEEGKKRKKERFSGEFLVLIMTNKCMCTYHHSGGF